MFFFEKKNQKTFVCLGTTVSVVSGSGKGEGIKVFWFFFSKKNIFLPTRDDVIAAFLPARTARPICRAQASRGTR
jgi:hypothetical protein